MIEINNLTTVSLDNDSLKRIVRNVLEEEGIKEEVNLSIAFVGDGRMKKANKKYRGKNRTTDVLSFPVEREHFKVEKRDLGEIVICLSEVRKNSKRYNSEFKKEVARVLIHGVLHLLGYDHEKTEKEAEKMENKQNHYLSKFLVN